jgi:transcriptional regulator with XRE-family HTH domain
MNQLTIGKFIAQKRKEKNLTQEQLAEKLGVSNKTVSKWECGVSHS